MNIWNFIKKDWAIFFRDRGAMLWLFILPLLFVTIFAGLARMSMGGATTEEVQDTRTPIPVVNLDVDGQLALQFLDQLDRVQGFKAEVYEAGAAEQALEQFKIRRYVVIPAEFSARLSQGERVTLSLIIHPDAELLEHANPGRYPQRCGG